MWTQSTGVGELCFCHQDIEPSIQGDRRETLAEKAHRSALCEGPSLCSEPGMCQGGGWFLEHALEQCGLGAHFSVSSGSLRLCSLPLSTTNLLHICRCARVLSMSTGGFGGDPPGNHSHHFLVTAFSSNRKSTQRQEPPLVCRHWGGPVRLLEQLRSPFCVGSTVMAVPSASKDQPRASVPVLLAIFYQQLSFILSSCFPFFNK